MHVVVVEGSQNENSNSSGVADYMVERCDQQGWAADVMNLVHMKLPFYQDDGDSAEATATARSELAARLEPAQALILITPEWAGMATPMMKNFLLMCTAEMIGHKPALLVAVSGGTGGAYPIAELRASSSKNNHICYIPDHVIVRNADHYLKNKDPIDAHEASLRERIDYQLNLLAAYAKALAAVRASGAVSYDKFRYGL